jgi:hypothetical protein
MGQKSIGPAVLGTQLEADAPIRPHILPLSFYISKFHQFTNNYKNN